MRILGSVRQRRIGLIDCDNKNKDEEATEKPGRTSIDFWSDEGARFCNEALAEGSAYLLAHPRTLGEFDEHLDDEQWKHLETDFGNPVEETLPQGEMKLILENCFIM